MKSLPVRFPPMAPPFGPRCAAAPSNELSSSPTVMKDPNALELRSESSWKFTASWLSEPALVPPNASAVGRLMKWHAQVSCLHSALCPVVPGLKSTVTELEPPFTAHS